MSEYFSVKLYSFQLELLYISLAGMIFQKLFQKYASQKDIKIAYVLKKSLSNYDKPELIDLGLILCSMGGFGLVLNACVCLNGMYSCIPCSFCKFTQVEPSPRSAHQHARHTSYMTSETSRHFGTSEDQPAPTDFDDGLPSYDEIFPPKAEF